MLKLGAVLERLKRRRHGLKLRPLCYGCHREIPAESVTFFGKKFCEPNCIYRVPTVLRRQMAREELRGAPSGNGHGANRVEVRA